MYTFLALVTTVVMGLGGTVLGTGIDYPEFGGITALATMGAFIIHAILHKR